MKIEMLDPRSLTAAEHNSRTHSGDQVAQIVASIQEFGFTNPILIDESAQIIAGHGRQAAALELDLPAVPCVVLAGLSDTQKRAYLIADNQLPLNAGWDLEKLKSELASLSSQDFDISVLGFESDFLADLLHLEPTLEGDPDHVPDAPEDPVSVPGDIWDLGDHRLACADATMLQSYTDLMAGRFADVVWTDPPYNVDYIGRTKDALKIKNDRMEDAAFVAFLSDAFVNVSAYLSAGSAVYIAYADLGGLAFHRAFQDAGFKLQSCLIWQKDSLVLGRSDYHSRHEPILYGWKPGAAHRWFGGRKQTTILNDPEQLLTVEDENTLLVSAGGQTFRVRAENMEVEDVRESVIIHPRPKASRAHPTMKPVGLIERMLKNSAKPGDVVLDPFGGSGSTLIAAGKLGLRARLLELDPRFVDVIVNRWQDLTGRTATHAETGEPFDARS